MNRGLNGRLTSEIGPIKEQNVYERLNHLGSPQAPRVQMEGTARLRCRIPAAHTHDNLDFALAAHTKIGREVGALE
jgi:hypothetical protein